MVIGQRLALLEAAAERAQFCVARRLLATIPKLHYSLPEEVVKLEARYDSAEITQQRLEILGMCCPVQGECHLDVGCGVGHLAFQIAGEIGPEGCIFGVDCSKAMIARAVAKSNEDHGEQKATSAVPQFFVGSAETLPFEDASFDTAYCVQTLSYVPDAFSALREMARVLKPGGRALIVDTDWQTALIASDEPERAHHVLSAMRRSYGFVDEHLPPKIPSLSHEAGFRIEKVNGFSLTAAGSFIPHSYFDVVARAPAAISEGVSMEEVRAFQIEQRGLSERNGFFYGLTRQMFLLRLL